jgi:hypothetical protein
MDLWAHCVTTEIPNAWRVHIGHRSTLVILPDYCMDGVNASMEDVLSSLGYEMCDAVYGADGSIPVRTR